MKLKYGLKTALNGLKINKLRSSLTILGIIIGITAIILIMSIGKGAQDLILSQIQGMGSKTIVVLPGRQPKGPADVGQIFSDSLKEKDLEALKRKENVPFLSRLMPVVFGGESAFYQGEAYRLTVFGASDLLSQIFDLTPKQGMFFGEDDIKSRADVVIIGSTVQEELFGSENPLNKKIRIKNRNFRVVGVLPKKGQVSFFNFDETAIIPYTTAQHYIFGIKYFHRFIIEAESKSRIPQTIRDIETTVRGSHNIDDPEKDDFHVESQADLAERLGAITNILTLFLVSVAAISLIVGGIGIMNIMFVSVTERTREIGLRKALGATEKNILIQFLLEAVILTSLGGIAGIILGAGLSFAASLVLTKLVSIPWAFVFPISALFLGLGVSGAIGLIFGLYPARKASLKSPIEALRYE